MELRQAFENKYPKYAGRIERLYREANDCELTFANITKPKLSRFASFLVDRLSRSSSRTYCAMFKAVLNLYNEEVDLPSGYASILSLKNDVSENAFLNDSEIQKLIKFEPSTRNERLVRNQFVLGCLTGARHSDYINFTHGNIQDERIVYVSQKTHIRAEIPLSPVVERLLKENEEYFMIDKEVSSPTFNATIRSICKQVGINERIKLYQAGEYVEGERWEFVSSHTARRSFATNLYLRGADLYLISKLMGHSSVNQTEGYICCGVRDIPDAIMKYFGSFK
ncbi:site-specific integrase [Bacteroides reticulotermitis]|uniref:Tyr recombinase domain-containing protein n=2 Tax=Bacteroides reticulotermitis TaxID=1133319 RepID=W4US23_9BACE|nr:site-specific integrase [Bacteroides reticulotermitis]MBB4043796.1 site-specific recombinase XerD [Bacteroides reticulotermitis]GAE83319.1 hypothetical protein JCM10512_1583 [Bacteroides reticulotermitis JCM 10512]